MTQRLERNPGAAFVVVGLVHHTHPTAADLSAQDEAIG